jgi:hypothetical protein
VAHGDSGEVGLEYRSDSSCTSMRSGNLTPDSADLGFLGFVTKGCSEALGLQNKFI